MNKPKLFSVICAPMAALLLNCFPVYAEAEVSVTDIPVVQKDGIVSYNGEDYYKVNAPAAGQDALIAAYDDEGELHALALDNGESVSAVWGFAQDKLGIAGEGAFNLVFEDEYQLKPTEGMLTLGENSTGLPPPPSSAGETPKRPISLDHWEYQNDTLYYVSGEVCFFLTFTEEGFSVTDDEAAASEIVLFSKGDTLGKCIGTQPGPAHYETADSGFAAPGFSVTLLNDDIIPDSVEWYIDGEAQGADTLNFSAEALTGRPAGLYRVYCKVEGHDSRYYYYKETSDTVNFIIAKGVIPNSVLTFSDVHQEFENIGQAIEQIMEENGGCIPSLIVNTGDWVTDFAAPDDDFRNIWFGKMLAQQGGIDSVFVSGNHDSSPATAELTFAAGLGTGNDLDDGVGVIFDSRSEDKNRNAGSSRGAEGLIVYGLNYDGLEKQTADGKKYTYENAISQLEAFLSELAKGYNNELIIISSHSGLHTLGVQPESTDADGKLIAEWAGDNEYNLDMSYELAELLNKYATEYNMDIMFLFGHDHSKGEAEFIITPGGELTSTKSFTDKTYGTQKIAFTYAHAGYISSKIGSADRHYSFIRWDDENIYTELKWLEDSSARSETIPRLAEEQGSTPESGEDSGTESRFKSDISETDSSQASDSSDTGTPPKDGNPNTGLPGKGAAVIILIAAAAVCRIKGRNG